MKVTFETDSRRLSIIMGTIIAHREKTQEVLNGPNSLTVKQTKFYEYLIMDLCDIEYDIQEALKNLR